MFLVDAAGAGTALVYGYPDQLARQEKVLLKG